jgi:hypothetical protein
MVQALGAHADQVPEPRVAERTTGRSPIPTTSGASVGRPTSSHAAFGRTLRALDGLDLRSVSYGEDVHPMTLSRLAGRRIGAGRAPAFRLPGVTIAEPAYAQAVDWMLCAALADLGRPGRGSYYFRLGTRPLDQAPFEAARARLGDTVLRHQVLAGAFRLVEARGPGAMAQIAASGPVLPEVLAAAAELAEEGVAIHVIDVTCPDRVFDAWQGSSAWGIRTATTPSLAGVLRHSFDPSVPLVTVHETAPECLAWLGAALGVPTVAAPSTDTGPGALVNAVLAALSLR